ncbi:MAG: T9SS type A sorting domain-containing protein [Bacteroidetes bacterium]|nr:T9SS type A sorting domain-containing protein [Bacteroidota bacterium]
MTKFYKLLKLSVFTLVLTFGKTIAQPCYFSSAYGTANINTYNSSMVNISTCNFAGEYATINVSVGGIYTFSVSTPADYLTLATGISSGSIIAGNAPITATLTPGTYYLHIAVGNTCGVNSVCQTTSYSNTALPGSPTLVTSPVNTMVCSGLPAVFTASATGASTLQWQSATSASGPWTNLTNTPPFSGVNTQTLTINPTSNTLNATYYQLVATNSVSAVSSTAALLTVIQSTTVPLIEDFNASTIFPSSWIVNATNPFYVFTNHGTAASNGMSRNLFIAPSSAIAQTPNTGVITASTSLKFDYRIVDYSGYPATATSTLDYTNDSLNIYISTDCGSTFSLLGSINASNHTPTTSFTSKSFNLSAYAGSSAIIRFKATYDISSFGDYYVDIDNINIYNAVPLDGGITAISQPAAGQPCYGSTQPVVVTISNFGTSALTSVPVDVFVNGALTTTVSGTYSGSIPPSGTTSFTVGTANMSAVGTYSFKAFTKILGDPTQANDTLLPVITRTVVPTGTIPYSESFAGLTAPPVAWNTNPSNPWYVTMNHGTAGSEGMYRNLYGSFANKAETTLMPIGVVTASTALSFDYRYQDWSGFPSSPATPTASLIYDTLAVRISTNCGLSYNTLASISGANHIASTTHANKTYSLGAYAGSNVILKFVATKTSTSSADYYVDVDNINLFNLSAIDGGVSALVTPGTSTCTSSSQPVVVSITNYGLGPISNVPVTVILSGPAAQTITSTYTGTIPVGSSVNYTVGNGNFSAGGTYTINSSTNLSGDGNNLNNNNTSTFTTANPVVSITGGTVACIGSSLTLNTSGTATSYTWSTGATTNSISVSPTVATTYSVVGSNSLSCSATSFFTVSVSNPTINAIGATGCGAPANGTLTASAFASSTVSWYSTPTPTGAIGTGNTFTISSASTTTVYAQATSQSVGFVGLTNTAVVAGGGQQTSTNYNIFDVMTPCTIQNVEVYPGAAGNVVIDLADNAGTILNTATFSVGAVSSTILPVNFSVPTGFGYRLGQGAGSVSLYRTSASSNIYPLTLPGVITITNSAAGNTFYYFCYNWQVSTQGCSSPVTPVIFTVTPSASVTAMASNTAVCLGNSSTLTANGASSYTWNPGNLTGSVVVVSPSVATTYTVLGGSGTCTGSAVQALTVNPSPAVSISPSQSICAGVVGVITLTTSSAGNTFTWNPGNSNNTTIVIPNPTVTTVYSVTATHPQGCQTTVSTTITVRNCAGVNEKTIADNTLIYPNPTNGLVHVSLLQGINNCEISIYDVTGRKVKSVRVNQTEATIDLKDFANGLYTYKIISNTNTVIKEGKIVKE